MNSARLLPLVIATCAASAACGVESTTGGSSSSSSGMPGPSAASISQGPGSVTTPGLLTCNVKGSRTSATGTIASTDGKTWTVPAETAFAAGPKAADLYNECDGVLLAGTAALDLSKVPLVEIDPDGAEVVGYLFADNYFELYVNGELVGVDAVPYTPFNSSVVRFKVKRPYTLAVKLVDWEEHLGLGTEQNMGSPYHAGDGGFIASFSDGTVTDATWRAQTFYISPLRDPACLSEEQGKRLSTSCAVADEPDGSQRYGAHWEVPAGWEAASFDDSAWPLATLYTEAEIGVDNKPAYTNFVDVFSGAGATFIWSTNVILDNEVIVRHTVQ